MAGNPRYSPVRAQVMPGSTAPSRCTCCRESDTLRRVTERLARCAVCGSLLPLPRVAGSVFAPTNLAAGLPVAPGAVLRERYRLVELIGNGAHGFTFLAHHEFLNHPCVVKILPFRIEETTDSSVRRLRNEASAGFRVNHPNVVRVLDGDAVEGIWYFVMEYVDGVDLAAAPRSGSLVDWRQAVRFAIDAARGLDSIHGAGLVHRDIKPGNLMLDTDGRVRIADLGVVRAVQDSPGFMGLSESDRAGTLPYAAPEVFSAGQEVGPQADLYSLGAALFELLTGSLPRGGSVYRTLLGTGSGAVSWPQSAPQDVPAWLRDAILRLLESAPTARFESAAALADFLEHPTQPLAPRSAWARSDLQEPFGLVVLPFENAGGAAGDDWLGHAIADHLARTLAQRDGAYVANLDQFLQTLERVKQRPACPIAEQLLEAGRLIGAGTVIAGTFQRSGASIELATQVYRAAQPAPTEMPPVAGVLSSLLAVETELCDRLTHLLGLAALDPSRRGKMNGYRSPAAEERYFTAKRAFFRGDYETAMRLGQEAIEIDPQFGEAVGFVGACYARVGRYDEAMEFNRRQRLLAAEGDERLMVEADANLGAMHYFRGEYEAAEDCLTRAARAAAEQGLTTELASIRNNLGFVLLQLGRQAEAEETYLHAIETHKRYGALVLLIGPYNGMGHVLREQQRYDEACGYFRRARALAQESDDYVNMGIAGMNLGHCALLQGRLTDAKHELAAALNTLEQTSFWNGLARVYEHMADLNLRLSNWVEAARCAEKRIELARRHANLRMEQAAWRQKAEALERAGRSAEARLCLAAARAEGSAE